jgi:hypothetical protein
MLPLFLLLPPPGLAETATDAIATGLMREDVYDYDVPAFESR